MIAGFSSISCAGYHEYFSRFKNVFIFGGPWVVSGRAPLGRKTLVSYMLLRRLPAVSSTFLTAILIKMNIATV